MSFLAPLYIAGALAIALPIIFHLIRRTPQNKQQFSSLMFLSPSPPRLSRRSRLTNIVLLILRAAVLCLLAFAFARPFFYRKADLNVNPSGGRRIAILVDTSASMRRGDLWDQAKRAVEQHLSDLTPADEVALFFFDRQTRPAFTFDQWNQTELSRRAPMLTAQLDSSSPTWASTNLGEALASVADQLADTTGNKQRNHENTRRQILLISDLQQGAHAEALQGHEWPANVSLVVKPLTLKQSTNASMELAKESIEPSGADDKVRVRVSNQSGSGSEQFTVAWANERGEIKSIQPQQVYVPPGRSRVIKVAWPAADEQADRLVLHGDDFDFDNALYVIRPQQEHVRIVYLGDDTPDDPKALNYYLHSAIADTADRKVEFVQRRAADRLIEADTTGARLVVLAADGISDDRAALLRHFAETGGTVLCVLKDVKASQGLARLLQINSIDVQESTAKDFVLIARIDLDHPIFAPFADARFGDFSKIHFWHHRSLKLTDPASARVIATFDNGDPFMLERTIGTGRILVMTCGWQQDDSQLALSTKFVPLIGGMLQRSDKNVAQTLYTVGDTIPNVGGADAPGVFGSGTTTTYAVNLSPDESRTTPLEASDLEHFGAKLGPDAAAPDVVLAQQRQLQLFELENRQKMWRWLILVVLGLVAAETILAGRLAHRSVSSAGHVYEQVSA